MQSMNPATQGSYASMAQTPSSIHFVHLPKKPARSRLPQPASERARMVREEAEPIILPPVHRSVLIRRGKNIPPTSALDAETTIQQVYLQGGRTIIDVPLKRIRQMPPDSTHVTQLVLCPNYTGGQGTKTCNKKRCRFVHADVDRSELGAAKGVHINYAWRCAEAVSYERFPAGEVLHVAVPNSKVTSDVMDSQMALKTKALESNRRPLSHCAHYYYNRTCNLGADCQFIHAVFIDPTANVNQRAPLPAQLGRGRNWVAATMNLQPEEEAIVNPAKAHPATFIDPLVQVMAGGLRTSLKFTEPPLVGSTESSLGSNATGCPPVVSSIEGSLDLVGSALASAAAASAAGLRDEPAEDTETPSWSTDLADDDTFEEEEEEQQHGADLTASLAPEMRYRHNPYTTTTKTSGI